MRSICTNFTASMYSMCPHRKMGIYVGFHSPSIIKYLEPLTGDLFTTWYTNYIFNEDYFPTLGVDYKYHSKCQEINWDDKSKMSYHPRTKEIKLQFQKIINLQHIANNLSDAFTDYKCVIKSCSKCARKSGVTKENHSNLSSIEEGEGDYRKG
jgi:hypothetical protein